MASVEGGLIIPLFTHARISTNAKNVREICACMYSRASAGCAMAIVLFRTSYINYIDNS